MNNNVLRLKLKNRLNKLSSQDYDNIEVWQFAEAFNKAQIEWVRRQVTGNNARKEGEEGSKRLIDDIQNLIKDVRLDETDLREGFYRTTSLPSDYLFLKKLSSKAYIPNGCAERNMVLYMVETSDVDLLRADELRKPSFKWAESFFTLSGNVFRIYTNSEFSLKDTRVMYYRKPKNVEFAGDTNLDTGEPVLVDKECEFKDDIAELIIDEAAVILAGDIESFQQAQRLKLNAQTNT